MQQVKDLALSLLWPRFDSWPRNFHMHMPQPWWKKKKKKKLHPIFHFLKQRLKLAFRLGLLWLPCKMASKGETLDSDAHQCEFSEAPLDARGDSQTRSLLRPDKDTAGKGRNQGHRSPKMLTGKV